MSKREGALKSRLYAELKRQHPEFLVLHLATAGAPDREVFGHGHTSYWECKHATPYIESPQNQVLMCSRIAAQGYCRYVIWRETKKGDRYTLIVHPLVILKHVDWFHRAEARCEGFDMDWLVQFIGSVHGVCPRPQNSFQKDLFLSDSVGSK